MDVCVRDRERERGEGKKSDTTLCEGKNCMNTRVSVRRLNGNRYQSICWIRNIINEYIRDNGRKGMEDEDVDTAYLERDRAAKGAEWSPPYDPTSDIVP